MTDTISMLSLQLGIFFFLAIKCCALYAAMRQESSLGWLTGALIFCAALAIALEALPTGRWEAAAAAIAMPAAIFCTAQAVRLVTRSQRVHASFWMAIGGIAVVDMILLWANAPYLAVAILLKLALGVAILEPAKRLLNADNRHLLDWPLIVLFALLSGLFLVHVPVWVGAFDLSEPYAAFVASGFESRMLLITGLLAAATVMLLVSRGLTQLVGELRYRMARDGDTGLYNREAFHEQVSLARGRYGAVAFCDIDQFKSINDRFGHAAGNEAIARFARILADSSPIAGRMGGDEFALYMPRATLEEAKAKIEEARERFAQSIFEDLGPDVRLTASFGLAPHQRGVPLSVSLDCADRALYRAKAEGRNRTVTDRGASDAPTGPDAASARVALA